MAVKKYYSTKKGKKVLKGFHVQPVLNGIILGEKYFAANEKTKAYVWQDQMIERAKKGYDRHMTLNDAFRLYIDNLDYATLNARLYAKKCWRCLELDAPHWLNSVMNDLVPSDISQLLDEIFRASSKRLGRPRKNLKREVDILSAVCRVYKYSRNNDFQNPVTTEHRRRWKFSKNRHDTVVSMTEEEGRQFLKKLKHHHEPVFYHIAVWQLSSHRQRIGEILSLEWCDVDWDAEIAWITGTILQADENGKTIRNTKQYHTKEGRAKIPVNFGGENTHLKNSLLALRDLNHHERWVFADKTSNIPTLRRVNDVYGRTGFFQEKGLGSHKCRKTALTLATIKCGVDLAKRLGGHATDSAHVRYIDRQLKELANPVPAKLAEALGLL